MGVTIQSMMAAVRAFTDKVTISAASGTAPLELTVSDDGASSVPGLSLYRESASPANADNGLRVSSYMRNASNAWVEMTRWNTLSADVTAGAEEGQYQFAGMKAGSLASYLTLRSGWVSFPSSLRFPSTQVASTGANDLDDYEENTWTPGMTFNGSSTSVAYTTQTGWYVKIGKKVFIWGTVTLSNNGTGTGSARVTGLPFTADALADAGGVVLTQWSGTSGVVGTPTGRILTGATVIDLIMSGATASVAMTDTNITNTGSFTFFGSYQADA